MPHRHPEYDQSFPRWGPDSVYQTKRNPHCIFRKPLGLIPQMISKMCVYARAKATKELDLTQNEMKFNVK